MTPGCVWSWCRVRMVPNGNGWYYMKIPGTGFCMKKLHTRCDGSDAECPERKPREVPDADTPD